MSEHPTYRGQVLDAAKDPLDLRDLYYEGTLDELPPWVNNRGMVPFVLDQQKEGACTGFALAAVVNFLLHNKAGAPMLKRADGGSARMLYEMAKRYDEWEGQNYEGSSIRAAMKGWYRHGACREAVCMIACYLPVTLALDLETTTTSMRIPIPPLMSAGMR